MPPIPDPPPVDRRWVAPPPPSSPPIAWATTPPPPGAPPPPPGWPPSLTPPPPPTPASAGPDPSAPPPWSPPSPPSALGAVTALAGLLAALAPILRWFEIDIVGPVGEVTVATTGWGSTGIEASDGLSVPTPVSMAWDGWAFAGVPDGVIATALGVALVVLGVRTALGTGRARPLGPALATGLGVIGLLWMAASWRAANEMVGDIEEVFTRFGAVSGGPVLVNDPFDLGLGAGFLLCTVAFAAAALSGFGSLWSVTGQKAALPAPASAAPSSPPGWP